MATQIVISPNDYIKLDDSFDIEWADKGKNWDSNWLPNTVHYVVWNNLSGPNEIQNKNASTGMMTGNTSLSATSDAVGTTTVANLLTWGETRKGQIEQAKTDFAAAGSGADGTASEGKTWIDYDSNYS
tara:strand:- start:2138 stop:2521 length:384 start_codon:yes stop_codon:yes gene_type:complete